MVRGTRLRVISEEFMLDMNLARFCQVFETRYLYFRLIDRRRLKRERRRIAKMTRAYQARCASYGTKTARISGTRPTMILMDDPQAEGFTDAEQKGILDWFERRFEHRLKPVADMLSPPPAL